MMSMSVLEAAHLPVCQRPARLSPVCLLPSTSGRSIFHSGRQICCPEPLQTRAGRTLTAQPVAFKFMKQLGLKKPDFLPDFGQEKRKALLDRFFTNLDHDTYNEVLADNFTLQERKAGATSYSKKDYINLALDTVKPSIPDFNWTHATDGKKDPKSEFCMVTVQATGRFTGKPFALPGLPQLEANGEKFLLAEERQMVKVEDGKIVKIEVLPQEGAGPRALYKALGGKI